MDYVISYDYDGEGFDSLNGIKKFNSNNNPYIDFKFALSDSGSAYFMDEKKNFENDDFLLNSVTVKIYKNKIKICHPYVPAEQWAKLASDNIIKSIVNRYDSFNCSTTEYTINEDNYFGCPHPHMDEYDVVKLFNNSLYNFSLEDYAKDELSNIDLNIKDEISLHVLKDLFGNKIGIYYVDEKDMFYFEEDNLFEKFNEMVFKLLVNNSPYEYVSDSSKELIDSDVLVLWLYWYGYPAINFWDYINKYLYLDNDKSYSRKNCFNYVRVNSPYITTLKLRRMEADLIELLDYEYPIRDINRESMIKYLKSSYNINIESILWDNGIEDNINSYVDVHVPPNSFDYEQNIGYKGDIIYYKSNKLPVKIALQLTRYKPVAPVEDGLMRFDESINTTPFAWHGKIIGVEKLNNTLTKSDIQSELNLNSSYMLYRSIFEDASQLRLKDLDEKLDYQFNEPDTTAWD